MNVRLTEIPQMNGSLMDIQLIKLYEQQSTLINRICGVTDSVLKDQLAEEYRDLEYNITNTENQYYHNKFNEIIIEHINYYNRMFYKTDIITALEKTNNIDINTILQKKRLRIPKLDNRRSLLLLANELSSIIVVKDLESRIVDCIGNTKESKKKYLYVDCFSKWQEYDCKIFNPVIHKILL